MIGVEPRLPEIDFAADEPAEIVGGVLRGPKSLRVRPQPARA
jgi:hypothetical protein